MSRLSPGFAAVLLAVPLVAAPPAVRADFTKAPDRPGGDNDLLCPPNVQRRPPGTGPFLPDPPNDPKDKDVNNDGRKDWFLGSYKYEKGNKDVELTIWCINGRPRTEFVSYEIKTSLRDPQTGSFVDTVRVPARAPI